MRNLESDSEFLKIYHHLPRFSSFLPVFFEKMLQQSSLNQAWIHDRRKMQADGMVFPGKRVGLYLLEKTAICETAIFMENGLDFSLS